MAKVAGTIEVTDEEYPDILKSALEKLQPCLGPKKLYWKGNYSDDIFGNCLAVVGSRRLTSYGRKATEQIVTEVAASGVTIVSGFMYGGDEAAHSAAVKCGGKTIAVMPCGIDLIHPANQKDLYQKILDNNGLIISEYEGLTQPQTFTYIQRDRIVAGLSKAVLVTEAALESGSLITAGYAKKYGRKIFALPGQITSEVSKGTTKLIKEGAEPVAEAKDILDFFKITPKFSKKTSHHNLSDSVKSDGIAGMLEEKIIEQLKLEPMKADEMARLFAVPVAQLGTALSLMQLKGFINHDNGKYYLN
ncbi:MAG: DNA-processing protein DprA [Candidatus Staskawiczbacteria bacterium]|nr:DNA-processing protein DprA [Candidatus Staskawiczbacteria bacterium]